MSKKFAIYLGWDLVNILQSVVTYETDEDDIIEIITQAGARYHVPAADIRKIVPPEYAIGDMVSPANHPELIGTIHGIGYYFKTEEPSYFITINGKRKSKRYFSEDLILRI